MSAKSKPQQTLTAAEVGGARAARARGARQLGRRPPAASGAGSRTTARAERDRRVPGREAAAVKTLVFLEHHGERSRGRRSRVLSKAGRARRRGWPGSSPARSVRELAAEAGRFGASTVFVADDPAPRRAAAPAAGRRPRRTRPRARASTPSCSRSRSWPPTSPPGSRCGSAPGSTGTWPTSARRTARSSASGRRSRDSVWVEAGWSFAGADRALPCRAPSTPSSARRGGGARARARASTSIRCSRSSSSRRSTSASGPSIEDADVVVAGGRGLGAPEKFALVEELAEALGGAVGATRAVVDAGWYPYSAQVGQTGKHRLAEALRRRGDLRRDPAQGRHAGLGHDRRDQQGPERADLRLRRPRRRRRPAPDRARGSPSSSGSARALVRPSEFPPPWSEAEAFAAPTDSDPIEVGVLVVGAGPAGLAAAIRLGPRSWPRIRRRPRRLGERAGCRAREGQGLGVPPALGGGDRPRAARSGCSTGSAPAEPPHLRPRARRVGALPDPEAVAAAADPPDDAQPRERGRLALAPRPLARRASRRRLAPRSSPRPPGRAPRRARRASSASAPAPRGRAGRARSWRGSSPAPTSAPG